MEDDCRCACAAIDEAMNIIVGVAVCVGAVLLWLRYRPTGHESAQLLALCLASGLVTALTLNPMGTAWSVVWLLVQLALCGLLLFLFRAEILRQRAEKARNAAINRRAEAKRMAAERAKMRARASLEEYFAACDVA